MLWTDLLRELVPSPLVLAAGIIVIAAACRALLPLRIVWRAYLGGAAAASVLLAAWFLIVGWAYEDPSGNHPTELSQSFLKYLVFVAREPTTWALVAAAVSVIVLLAGLGLATGVAARRLWAGLRAAKTAV